MCRSIAHLVDTFVLPRKVEFKCYVMFLDLVKFSVILFVVGFAILSFINNVYVRPLKHDGTYTFDEANKKMDRNLYIFLGLWVMLSVAYVVLYD